MREDYWTHSKNHNTIGVNGQLGSPRSWLRRAFGSNSLESTSFAADDLTPGEISVAGIWYRPCQLPEIGHYRTLYKFSEIVAPEHLSRAPGHTLYPAIGVAIAAPMHEVMGWIKLFKLEGATFTWWKTPQNNSNRIVLDKAPKRQLDHAQVYAMLDQGMGIAEIANKLDFAHNNISYVAKKWQRNVPLRTPTVFADKEQLLNDLRNGCKVPELSVKYKKSPAYIYKLMKDYK